MSLFRKFLRDERGATAIEYVMIAGLVSIMCIAGATSIGTTVSSAFIDKVGSALQ